MSSDGIKLYESGTPKLNLLFCISHVDGIYCRRIKSREISFILCISCVILIYLSLCCVLGKSLRRLGRLLRIIKLHRTVSCLFPTAVGNSIEVIKSEIVISRVIKLIGVAVYILIVTAGNSINRRFKQINVTLSGIVRIKRFDSRIKFIGISLILCKVICICKVSDHTGSKIIISGIYKSFLIVCPCGISR